ncbi:MAG: cobalamin-dependent protein [Chloroflexaceae bacterium]|jgi:methanogenic corrinoid protein MtbC1|nr:cobalamin-dependent protein [Chloroflexaceae bacterium]
MTQELPPLETFLDALLSGDSRACLTLTTPAVQSPTDLRRLYMALLQPALYEVGTLWAAHRISVAQEHLATAVVQRLMAQFYPLLASVPRHGHRALLTTAPGELHEIGARMVADFLELEGWTVAYLGANAPGSDLCDFAVEYKPELIGISAGIVSSLPRVAAAIESIRAAASYQPMIMVGGQAFFQNSPDLWQRLGADAYAPTAAQAVRALSARNSDGAP